MFLWFLGTALVSVYFVFTDPRFDYRLLLVGSLVPDLIDVPFGQARWAHSLTVAVGVLASVMLVTAGHDARSALGAQRLHARRERGGVEDAEVRLDEPAARVIEQRRRQAARADRRVDCATEAWRA